MQVPFRSLYSVLSLPFSHSPLNRLVTLALSYSPNACPYDTLRRRYPAALKAVVVWRFMRSIYVCMAFHIDVSEFNDGTYFQTTKFRSQKNKWTYLRTGSKSCFHNLLLCHCGEKEFILRYVRSSSHFQAVFMTVVMCESAISHLESKQTDFLQLEIKINLKCFYRTPNKFYISF